MKRFIKPIKKFCTETMLRPPTYLDALALTLFAVAVIIQPYILRGGINFFELGIYLPGITSFMRGAVPYRDFFHLRGPLEIYIPAFFMQLVGVRMSVLNFYFYIGTVFGMIVCVFIARELLKHRLVLYLLVPVLVARTFPRVVYHIWGGFRFSIPLLALLFILYFLRSGKRLWMALAGVCGAVAFFISVEMGVCVTIMASGLVVYSLVFRYWDTKTAVTLLGWYAGGFALAALPEIIYLVATGSLGPYIESTMSVVRNMTHTFPDYFFEDHPKNALECLAAMNPGNKHFKHLTPAYCYLAFAGYWFYLKRTGQLNGAERPLVVIVIYGLMMYLLAFRKIGAGQFEMALQPEKIILFVLLERLFVFFKEQIDQLQPLYAKLTAGKRKRSVSIKLGLIYFLIAGFVGSSWGYAFSRYGKRFNAYQCVRNVLMGRDVSANMPIANEEVERLTIPTVENMVVPKSQADNVNALYQFIQKNTEPGEPVFMFPEFGGYSFMVDRPYISRFPMVTFTWINDNWHRELMRDLKKTAPRFVVVDKKLDRTFKKAYFMVHKNREMFDEVAQYLERNYVIYHMTPLFYILKRKDSLRNYSGPTKAFIPEQVWGL